MIRFLIFLLALPLLAESSFTFRVSKSAEVIADLDLSGGDWSVEGKEAALANISSK